MSQTIDHLEPVQAVLMDYSNEIRTLESLRFGLYHLANIVSSYEEPLRQRDSARSVRTSIFGEDPRVPPAQRLVLPCFFHWFAVTVCNYARLVGFVRGLERQEFVRSDLSNSAGKRRIKTHCAAYVHGLSDLRSVLLWRNKVAAHPAITAPYPEDNIATLEMSVFYPLGYDNGRFYVSPLSLVLKGVNGVQQSTLPCWSLTGVWQTLRPRYWPDLMLQTENAVQG
jgi:hypothetical protein